MDKSIELTNDIRIKTADNATLRYYIYKPITVEDVYKSVIIENPPLIWYSVPATSITSENAEDASTSTAVEPPSPQ